MLGDPTGQLDVVGGEAALERHPHVGRLQLVLLEGDALLGSGGERRERHRQLGVVLGVGAPGGVAAVLVEQLRRRSGASSPAAGTAGCARPRPVRPSTGRPAPPSGRSPRPDRTPRPAAPSRRPAGRTRRRTPRAARSRGAGADRAGPATTRRRRGTSGAEAGTRRPAVSPSSRSLSDVSSPSAPSARTRAAASSTASGKPSRRWQMAPTDACSSGATVPPASAARRRKRSTAPPDPAMPTGSGWTGHTRSPSTSSGWRLVASTVTDDELRRIVATTSAAASRTCSQLSTTISPCSPPATARSSSSMASSGRPGRSRAWHTAIATPRRRADRHQVDEPHALRPSTAAPMGDLERQPRLADAAGADQRDQAGPDGPPRPAGAARRRDRPALTSVAAAAPTPARPPAPDEAPRPRR